MSFGASTVASGNYYMYYMFTTCIYMYYMFTTCMYMYYMFTTC